jgi:ABC-type molybdate transport system permease subunit
MSPFHHVMLSVRLSRSYSTLQFMLKMKFSVDHKQTFCSFLTNLYPSPLTVPPSCSGTDLDHLLSTLSCLTKLTQSLRVISLGNSKTSFFFSKMTKCFQEFLVLNSLFSLHVHIRYIFVECNFCDFTR